MKYLVLLISLFAVACSGGTYCYHVQPNGDVVEFECSGQAEVTEDGEDPVMSDGGVFTIPWNWYPWSLADFDSGVDEDGGNVTVDSSVETDAGLGDGSDGGDNTDNDGGDESDAGTPLGNDGGSDAGSDDDGSDDTDDNDDDVDESGHDDDGRDEDKCKCKVEIVEVTGTHPNSGKEKKFVCPFRSCTGDCEGDPRPKGLLSVCKRLQ